MNTPPASEDMPTGALAERILVELASLARALLRLEDHADRGGHDGLTEPDQPSGEQWDSGQVWSHIAEFGSYWLPELHHIVDSASDDPVPFGRTKSDNHRIEQIERNRHERTSDMLNIARSDIALFAHALASMSASDWTRTGSHSTLGDMDLWTFLEHFVTGHYHEHAGQLDLLSGASK